MNILYGFRLFPDLSRLDSRDEATSFNKKLIPEKLRSSDW